MSRTLILMLVLLAPTASAAPPGVDALTQAIIANQLDAARTAIGQVVEGGSAEAAAALVKLTGPATRRGRAWYWAMVRGLASFRTAPALGKVRAFVLSQKRRPIARDVLFWLQANRSPHTGPLLLKVAGAGPPQLQRVALSLLGELGDKDSVDGLLALLAKHAKARPPLPDWIRAALAAITGRDFGESVDVWTTWWKANRDKPLASKKTAGETGTAADALGGTRSVDYGKLTGLDKTQVLVLGASDPDLNFDTIETMLAKMKIPHTVVTKKAMNANQVDLRKAIVIFVNCSDYEEMCVCPKCGEGEEQGRGVTCSGCDRHIWFKDRLEKAAIARIATWVGRGGYLFSEDWALTELIGEAFPRRVRSAPRMKEQTVAIQCGEHASGHPVLAGVFGAPVGAAGASAGPAYETRPHTWKVDEDSPAIQVVDRRRVLTLLESPALGQDGAAGAVAVLFATGAGDPHRSGLVPPGKLAGGRVLHVLSHFGKQASERDDHTLQNLLLNFLIEAHQRWAVKHPRKR